MDSVKPARDPGLDLWNSYGKHTAAMSYVCGVIMSGMAIQERIERNLVRSNDAVFVRADFDKLGGYDQVEEPCSTS